MGFIYYNPNPSRRQVGDCVVRAVSMALGLDWEQAYMELSLQGFMMHDMPSSDDVWGALLNDYGFQRFVIPNSCPSCYAIVDFCNDNPKGTYVLGTGTHAVTVIDGNYYDAWDSGYKKPLYFWAKG